MRNDEFGFGIETEFILASKRDFRALTHEDLSCERLLALVDAIKTSDISTRGLNLKPLHEKISPYLIEGYCLTDEHMKPTSLLPKGVEIRTPVANTITESISNLHSLFNRLRDALSAQGMVPVILSHHPTQENLQAPPNYERHDYWQWALTATTTFGPDINISVPSELTGDINIDRLMARMNYYGPSAVALSLAAPFFEGDLWRIRGQVGKSIRTYRRSIWAPQIYVHHKPSLRFEFKGFEMALGLDDYHAFFLIALAILLDETLSGEASDQSRIYDLGQIAVCGLDSDITRERAAKVLERAQVIADRFGFQQRGLNEMWRRIQNRTVPADDLVEIFQREKSIERTISCLTDFCASGHLPAPLTVSH